MSDKDISPSDTVSQAKEDATTSFLHINVKPSDKAAWVKAAKSNGGLKKWVTTSLNEAAAKEAR
jgi:hypothetical protein